MRTSFLKKLTRHIVAITLIFSLVTPQVASAQLVTSDPIAAAWSAIKYISDKIFQVIGPVLQNAATVAVVNVGQQVARDAAESVATWVSTGGSGQNPLQYMRNPVDYVKDAGADALGEFVGGFSESMGLGDLLCRPPAAAISVPTGLLSAFQPPDLGLEFGGRVEPKCNVSDMLDAYTALGDSLQPDALLGQIQDAAIAGQNEVSSVMADQVKAFSQINIAQQKTDRQIAASPSHAPVVSPISGETLRPGSLVALEAEANTVKVQQDRENVQMSGLLASGAQAIPAIFASTLFNSLAKKGLERLTRGKGSVKTKAELGLNLNLANPFGGGKSVSNSGGPNAIYTGTKAAVIAEGEWDQLTIFSSCPPEFASTDNCVIEQSFASAIRNAQAGKPLTVKEALQNGTLKADWELVPPSAVAKNEDKLCYQSAYCYSNLVKLRKARIIPIGWEIAAANSDGGGKVTLGLVASKFNDCAYDATTGKSYRDDKHPYCHLIDPDWVLKMPQNICKAKVFGAIPETSQGATRKQECADQVTCLQEDETGQCTGAYGYCMRERNTWRFDADQCPAQYAGCRTFANTQSGEITVIESTVESSQCSAQNSGCTGYITDYNSAGAYDTESTKIYLTAQAAQCAAKYAGCTEVVNSNTAQTQFIVVPPATLGCKGAPSDPEECKKYAQACTVDEVGCELYKPAAGAEQAIPGIATFATRDATGAVVGGEWNDECSAECVGYASYYQQPTQAEPAADATVAFIPKSATQCTEEDAGCDAYLNIDTTQKGGGKTEYFSEVQRCRRPDDPGVNAQVFYTWEGSDQSGYQLHQHTLAVDGAGAPLYDADVVEAAKLVAGCTAEIYKTDRLIFELSDTLHTNGKPNPAFNPDCREIITSKGTGGAQGATYYRYLSKTLPVTAACTGFRKEKSDKINCEASRGVFDAASGACEYEVIPAQSQMCKQEAVGCRGYQGATAADAKNILTANFGAVDEWQGGALSQEGITVGDSVLKSVVGAPVSHALTLAGGKTYNVRFWAKGQGTFEANIVSPANNAATYKLNQAPLTLTPEWRAFELNSGNIAAADAAAKINFVPGGAATLYIDNVVVKEQGEVIYAIKDTWVTPNSCDPNLEDGLPGPALNCREFQPQSDTKKPKVYLTSFTNLCRPQSAGCAKYQNTYNTPEITAREVPISLDGKITKTIPADDFVYLVANKASFCPADKKGCTALGVNVYDAKGQKSISTIYKMNVPETYERTACKQEEEWCQTFTSGQGQQRYFKYPAQDHQCEYQDAIEKNGTTFSGWVKKGTSEPCYADNITSANAYGIYRNADAKYAGNIGLCPKENNACTAFVDHADVSRDFPAGRAYYMMSNAKLDTTSCNGNASLKDGCVLLEDTTRPAENKYATLATYCKSDGTVSPLCAGILAAANVSADDRRKDGVPVAPVSSVPFTTPVAAYGFKCSVANNNGLFAATACEDKLKKLKEVADLTKIPYPKLTSLPYVSPIDCTVPGMVSNAIDLVRTACNTFADANTLVKVRRDRTCSEWLSCKSSSTVYDKQTGKYKDVCSELGVCNELSSDSGAVGQCGNWVVPQKDSKEELERVTPLSTNHYVSRNVGWYGQEYSGFSLWNKFQPDQLGWFIPPGGSEMVLGAGLRSDGSNSILGTVNCTNPQLKPDGEPCQAKLVNDPKFNKDNDLTYTGTCYSGKCWYSPDGFKRKQATIDDYTKLSCRGYPETDSPFPTSVVAGTNDFDVPIKLATGFSAVNVCDKNSYIQLIRSADDWLDINDFAAILGLSPYKMVNGSCECSYRKIKYGDIGETHFFSLSNKNKFEYFPAGTQVIPKNSCWNQNNTTPRAVAVVTSAVNGLYDVQYPEGACSSIPSNKLSSLSVSDFWVPGRGVNNIAKGIIVGLGLSDKSQGGNGFWYPITINSYDSKTGIYAVTFPLGEKFNLKNDQIAAPSSAVSSVSVDIPPIGVCDGGWFVFGDKKLNPPHAVSKKGVSCTTNSDCVDERVTKIKMKESVKAGGIAATKDNLQYSQEDGHCQFQKENIQFVGWQGYCLEQDLRTHVNNDSAARSCLTWLPLDVGGVDLYNLYTSASYQVPADGTGKYYCALATGRKDSTKVGQDAYALPARPWKDTNSEEFLYGTKYILGQVDYLNLGSESNTNRGSVAEYISTVIASNNKYYKIHLLTSQTDKNPFLNEISSSAVYQSRVIGSEGYKNYGKAYLPPKGGAEINISEIDYIEVTANSQNSFFPEGYAMKIVNDGVVRVYTQPSYFAKKTDSVGKSAKCLVQRGDKKADELYDFLNPIGNGIDMKKSYLQTPGTSDYKQAQSELLSQLSAQVRCSEYAKKMGGQPFSSCDYYKGGDPDPKYFSCSSGEQSGDMQDKGRSMAITGVAKYGGTPTERFIPQIADVGTCKEDEKACKSSKDCTWSAGGSSGYTYNANYCTLSTNNPTGSDTNKSYGAIWFVRADTRGQRYDGAELGNNGLLYDIIQKGTGDSSLEFGVSESDGGNLIWPGKNWKWNTACNAGMSDVLSGSSTNTEGAAQFLYTLRFKFNPDGTFDGMDAGSCQARIYEAFNPVGWIVKMHMRDMCRDVARVVSDDGENAAWTQRLWTGVPNSKAKKYIDSYMKPDGSVPVAVKGQVPPPEYFGSFSSLLKPGASGVSNDAWYTHAVQVSGTSPQFTDLVANAKGFSCSSDAPYSCVDGISGSVDMDFGGIVNENGTSALTNLFATIYDVYTFQSVDNINKYQTFKTDGNAKNRYANSSKPKSALDVRGAKYAIDAHPVVFALDPAACEGSTQTCRMTQRNAFTINGVWQTGESVYAKESLTAKLQFYGWADENHLPLKSVTVNWGDGTTPLFKDGMYRNHKAVCSTSDVRPPTVCVNSAGKILDINQTCNTSSDCVGDQGQKITDAVCQKLDDPLQWSFGSWAGNISGDDGACETNMFQFGHAYTFTEGCGTVTDQSGTPVVAGGQMLTGDTDTIAKYGLKGKVGMGERFCVFKPRVRLIDNWGVCNGVDETSGKPAGNGGKEQNGELTCLEKPGVSFTPYQGYVIVKE